MKTSCFLSGVCVFVYCVFQCTLVLQGCFLRWVCACVSVCLCLTVPWYRRDAQRYRGFLGINKEAKNIADSQKTMKTQGDPVSRVIGPDNLKDIAQARKDIPADK